MNGRKEKNLKRIRRFLPEKLSSALEKLPADAAEELCEIRLRRDKPAVLIFTREKRFITASGRLTGFMSNNLPVLSESEINEVFNAMCGYSVHSLTDNIAEGFITLEGGCRAGVYGTAVTENGRVVSVRSISGVNIRISGEYPKAGEPIFRETEGRANILICGPPCSGKTTVLLGLCRLFSDVLGRKVCLVDERGEADGFDCGINTDVLTGYPKAAGIQTSVRTLSPDIVAFDEAGTAEETEAVCGGLNSGVEFIMTMHCRSMDELVKKPQYRALCECGAVEYIAFLRDLQVSEIIRAKEHENENRRPDRSGSHLRSCGTVYSLEA